MFYTFSVRFQFVLYWSRVIATNVDFMYIPNKYRFGRLKKNRLIKMKHKQNINENLIVK